MSTVMNSLFEDEFLRRFAKKPKTELTDLKVMKLLNEIWCEDETVSQTEYLTRLDNWMQHNNQRFDNPDDDEDTFDRIDWKFDNNVEQVEFEFREPTAAKAAPPVLNTAKLGKRKMVVAPKPIAPLKVEIWQPNPEVAVPLPVKLDHSPVKSTSSNANIMLELRETMSKGQILKVTADNVVYVDYLLKNDAKVRDAMVSYVL
jgi:hypothetical protein